MKPYLVDSVTNYKGAVISSTKPEKYAELMTAKEASMLKDYMSSVTKYGNSSISNERNKLYNSRKDRNSRVQFG